MSMISLVFKQIILWLLGDSSVETLIGIATPIVTRLHIEDDFSPDVKRSQAQQEIREKLEALKKPYKNHHINIAIEMALIPLKENIE